VVARAEEGGVLVVWRLSPEPDAAGYVVERSEEVAGPFVRITATPVPVDRPSLLDTSATGGHRYFYRVIALDQSGNASAPSSLAQAVVVDRTPPAAPEGVTATPAAHRLTVRWRRSAARDLMGYYVYRATPGRVAARLTRLPVADTVFVDSGYGTAGLRPGGQFVIGVSAVDSARNESPQTAALVLVPDDEPPDPPSGLLARDVDGRFVELAWSAPQAPDVAGYEVQRAANDSAFVPLAHVTGRPPFAVRDTAVAHGRRYVYRVVAVDSAGNRSVPAVDSLAFRRPTPPPAPRNLAARATPEGVVLVWERVADPELAGYRVYRSPLPTGTFEPLSDHLIVGTTATDTAPSPGTYYRVRAVDTSGNESAPSPAARVGTP
jgi:fibronectin type 3 domain-containing protein